MSNQPLKTIVSIVIILAYCSIAAVGGAVTHIEPVDETQEDGSFAVFKKELKTAIQKKNSTFIEKILSDDVEYAFGADPERKSAVDGFLRHYELKDRNSFVFWKNLKEVIDLGCTKSGESFVCPYVYSKWPDKLDSFSFVVTTKAKTPVRRKPESSAEILKFASVEILKLTHVQQESLWYSVELGGKQIGFVSKSEARGPTDYRAEFQKTSKGWRLTYFIAGD